MLKSSLNWAASCLDGSGAHPLREPFLEGEAERGGPTEPLFSSLLSLPLFGLSSSLTDSHRIFAMSWITSQTLCLLSLLTSLRLASVSATAAEERALPAVSRPSWALDAGDPPEGYYAFIESPSAEPPRVRRPPYQHTNTRCPGIGQVHLHASLDNLCGDLNQGIIPRNPMDQNVMGSSYPFALIKNKTLEFFSKTLPILKEDDTLPKVAKYQQGKNKDYKYNPIHQRVKREENQQTVVSETSEKDEEKHGMEQEAGLNVTSPPTRQSRKFCDNGGGVICMLYKAFRGEPLASGMGERKDEEPTQPSTAQYRRGEVGDINSSGNSINRITPNNQQGPPTPCPSKAEYATPVFARNYQGVWRYVVQIPYEGYFTQTVEVTRCLQSRCYYMEGSCMASPRWVSLLVAEIFYPDSVFPMDSMNSGGRQPARRHRPAIQSTERPPLHDFQDYQQYLHKRSGEPVFEEHSSPVYKSDDNLSNESEKSGREAKATGAAGYCDGKDEMGCFQVRLYYDWFLIPGSCKCWRPDYFSRYTNRKS